MHPEPKSMTQPYSNLAYLLVMYMIVTQLSYSAIALLKKAIDTLIGNVLLASHSAES